MLRKVYSALADGGAFAFTLKQGEGEEWTEAKLGASRYFCYWNKNQISEALHQAGFSHFSVTSDQVTPNATWLQIIARK